MIGPKRPPNHRSVYGKIYQVVRANPGVTGEELVERLRSVDFSTNPSASTQAGRVSLPWLAGYIDGGFCFLATDHHRRATVAPEATAKHLRIDRVMRPYLEAIVA
jgi:hypothetical protein